MPWASRHRIPVRQILPGLVLLALAFAAIITAPLPASAFAIRQDPVLARLLEQRGVSGVIVLYDPRSTTASVSHRQRASQPFLPASTYKIAGALLALETGIVKDPFHDRLKWDGKPFFIKECEADQTLATAIARSCVPVFARLGREIGDRRLKAGLQAIGYGNGLASGRYPYWTEGDLRISALEQVTFLDRLRRRDLPLSATTMDQVAAMIELERQGDYVLRGKTGWAARPDPDIGWFVGWAEKGDDVRVFAVNIDMRGRQDIPLRIELAKAALAAHGLAP